MAKVRKPFVSRKVRRERETTRLRRESLAAEDVKRRSEQLNQVNATGKDVFLPAVATVEEFSNSLDLPVVRVISQLMKNGVMAAMHDRIDYDTMAIVADELGYKPAILVNDRHTSTEPIKLDIQTGVTRPPIVTIMGHVDHGKTSLLDFIRQTNVAGGEFGGITQHIGAYQTEVNYEKTRRTITFLDTPGHEAFTALRSHGAQVTDIAVIVVAADDGVKPQTIEAINHAKAASVPIIVAITKIDLASANIEMVKQQLVEYELIPEEWGGKTLFVPISSKTGEGTQRLLEYILLTADLKNLKADPDAVAQGVIIESHQEVGLGAVATVLIQNGTLHEGDVVVVGQTFGKIRLMTDFKGKRIKTATPSMPVMISGINDVPNFGESFVVAPDEKTAREQAETHAKVGTNRLGDITQRIREGQTSVVNIVLKADAQGSLEALLSSIAKLSEANVKPMIVHSAVGDISLTDIQLASASQAMVFGFNVALPTQIKKAAHNMGVAVGTYKIIYDLLASVTAAVKGKIEYATIKVEIGRLKVKKIFRATKNNQIVGGEITQGIAGDEATVIIHRDDETVGDGKVVSLHKGPESIHELSAGEECGVNIESTVKVKVGDVLIFEKEEQVLSGQE